MINAYTENVKRGAALLDLEHPGWRDIIDIATLDLSDHCFCILGQVFGDYNSGLAVLWGMDPYAFSNTGWIVSDSLQTVVAHGFSVDFVPPCFYKWQTLQEAWETELGTCPPQGA